MKQKISTYIKDVLQSQFSLQIEDIKLETPPKKDMWDISFGCFLLARELKKSPQDIAKLLVEVMSNDPKKTLEIEKISAMGPYINFYLSTESYIEEFTSLIAWENLYWDREQNAKETIYIDYIGANVGKPLHIWHMCTPSQWQVFINLFKKKWYTVISDSHLGDWGIIFGKLIVAYEKYGKDEKLKEDAVKHLFELYVQISTDSENDTFLEEEFRWAFKKLSQWDTHMKALWAKFTRFSVDAMNIQLSRIFVYPQYNIGESFYEWLGLEKMEDYPDLKYSMKDIVWELIKKGVATQNEDGSVWVVFPDSMKIPSCILQKRDGTHWYLASDLASIKYRMENWSPKKIIYFVDVRQQLHLRQTFTIAKMAHWFDENTEISHAHNGFVSLKDGAMSTRKWKIIKLSDLLDEAELRASKIIKEKRSDISDADLDELSKIIWVGAIKYGYLKKSRETDVVFDWDEFMSFEWNSGPYIQYWYVRAQKILQKYEWEIHYTDLIFQTDEEKQLVKHILSFPKVIQEMSSTYHAHILCQYVYDLTKYFSSFYNNIPILSETDEKLKRSRITLLKWFSRVVEESFEILWIPLPKEM